MSTKIKNSVLRLLILQADISLIDKSRKVEPVGSDVPC